MSIDPVMWILPVFNSASFPSSYNENSYCIWLLPASKKSNTVAYLTFYSIDLTYDGTDNSQDSIWITEWGNSTNATITHIFSDKTIKNLTVKKIHANQSPMASVTLRSNNNRKRGKGFSAGGLISEEGKILALCNSLLSLLYLDHIELIRLLVHFKYFHMSIQDSHKHLRWRSLEQYLMAFSRLLLLHNFSP